MSISASASRFACLQDDDSADWKGPKNKPKAKKEEPKKTVNNKPKDPAKAKAIKDAKELQSLAFGGQKKKNKKKGNTNTPQHEQSPPKTVSQKEATPPKANCPESTAIVDQQWEQKEKELLDENFKDAMQEAIMQSKLEFEQQKAILQEQERLLASGIITDSMLNSLSKEERKRLVKQQKKPTTISLDQFNSDQTTTPTIKVDPDPVVPEPQVYRHPRHKDRIGPIKVSPPKDLREEGDFFNQMDVAAAKALSREQMLESYKNQESSNASESALVANYREKLIEKDQELQKANAEIVSLNSKLTEVKLRSKKLTEILMSGEMREKTEVLVQVHKLEKVRDELGSTLAFTSAQLEQERSLVHQLEIEIKKEAGAGGSEKDLCNRLLGILKTKK